MEWPLALIAFARPKYFEQVVTSLVDQRARTVDRDRVFLFQDGAINPHSNERKADDEMLRAVRTIFLHFFPKQNVFASEFNFGTARNIRRAEAFIFETCDAEIGLFLEDDLVLAPCYLEMMHRIGCLAREKGNVAYFAAYGDQLGHFSNWHTSLVPLEHHWAFGLLREAWVKMDAVVAPYYDIIAQTDYTYRDNARIFDLYESIGFGASATSQDGMKAVACVKLGLSRINVRPTYAKYIGRQGIHMYPERYDQLGFDRIKIVEEPISIPSGGFSGDVNLVQQEQLTRALKVHSQLAHLRTQARPPVRSFRRRIVDEDLARWTYRIMLLREIESEERVKEIVQRRLSIEQFVKEVANDWEFRRTVLGLAP
jgi:hypothetical protein